MVTSSALARGLGLALLCAAAPLSRCEAQLEGGAAIGSRAPVVVTTDLENRPVDLGTWLGKGPVVLEFWASWCIPCQQLMPKVDSAYAQFHDRVTFVGINVALNDSVPAIRAWIDRFHPGFHVLFDSAATAVRAYDVQATSTVFIIARDGRVAYAGVGAAQQLSAALTRILSTDPPPRSN